MQIIKSDQDLSGKSPQRYRIMAQVALLGVASFFLLILLLAIFGGCFHLFNQNEPLLQRGLWVLGNSIFVVISIKGMSYFVSIKRRLSANEIVLSPKVWIAIGVLGAVVGILLKVFIERNSNSRFNNLLFFLYAAVCFAVGREHQKLLKEAKSNSN